MLSIGRTRERLPLVALIFLVLLAAMLVGFACACLTDHPIQAIEKALSAIPAAPAIMETWSLVAAALIGMGLAHRRSRSSPDRASPALLQRFLF